MIQMKKDKVDWKIVYNIGTPEDRNLETVTILAETKEEALEKYKKRKFKSPVVSITKIN